MKDKQHNTTQTLSCLFFPPLIFCLFTELLYFIGSSGVQLVCLYKESSPNGTMPICVSYGSSPTSRRHTVFPVFQPLISGLLSILGLPEVSACCTTASKAGWATAWWRMLNTYLPGPCTRFCVCLSPSQPIIIVTINLAWDTLWKSTEASELVHVAAQCWEGSGWQTRNTSPLRWPTLPCQSYIVGRSSWKPALLSKRPGEFPVGNATALFIYFIYLPHSSHKLDFP